MDQPQPPLLTDDVARILTEESRAAHARRIVTGKIQPVVRECAAAMHIPAEDGQQIEVLAADLGNWATKPITDEMSEQAVEEVVGELRQLLGRLDRLDGRKAHVKTARQDLAPVQRRIETYWDRRRRPTVKPVTVRLYLDGSYPANPDRRAKYADRPMPPPQASVDRDRARGLQDLRGRRRGQQAMWYPHQEHDLRVWYRTALGAGSGAGGGRPRKNPASGGER